MQIYVCSECWWTMHETTLAYNRTTETKSEDRISLCCLLCNHWAIIPRR